MLRAALPLLDVDRAVLASHDAAALDDRRIAAFAAGHPSPNGESVRAAERALALRSREQRSRRAARAAVGWRLGDARRARRRRRSRRQAGDRAAADARRCGDRRAELRAQAPVAHQGRPARGCGRHDRHAGAVGRPRTRRRRSVGDRFRTDGGRSHDLRRCGGDRREVPRRASARVCAIISPPACGAPRRKRSRPTTLVSNHRATPSSATGRQPWTAPAAPRSSFGLRRDRPGRGHRRRSEPGRRGIRLDGAARRIGAAASGLCAGIRRNDRHGSRQRFGRTQSGVRARERGGVERRSRAGASSSAAPERMASTARRRLPGPWSTRRRSSGPAPWA